MSGCAHTGASARSDVALIVQSQTDVRIKGEAVARALESQLSAYGYRLAERGAAREAVEPPSLTDVEELFYDVRLDEASMALDAHLQGLESMEQSVEPLQLARAFLLGARVEESRRREERMRAYLERARSVLGLRSLDPSSHPPKLVKRYTELPPPREVPLEIESLPADATLQIDGAPIAQGDLVFSGLHLLEVSARGRRTIRRWVEVKGEPIALPSSFDPGTLGTSSAHPPLEIEPTARAIASAAGFEATPLRATRLGRDLELTLSLPREPRVLRHVAPVTASVDLLAAGLIRDLERARADLSRRAKKRAIALYVTVGAVVLLGGGFAIAASQGAFSPDPKWQGRGTVEVEP